VGKLLAGEVMKKLFAGLVVLGLSLGTIAAQSQETSQSGQMMQMKMKGGMSPSAADQGYMEAMQKMHETMMSMEMTGKADVDFASMMIPHHQSAIDMSKALLKQEKIDPEIKRMAQKIIKDQEKEIAEFQKWLSKHKE
jgi:uncharacterized protein (DUF305 family)